MFAFLASECGWAPNYAAENLTLRQVDYILEGVRVINEVEDKEDSDVSDDDIDKQFADLSIAGREAGSRYNVKSVQVARSDLAGLPS